MIVVVMGVAGSGKSTIGALLARQLRWRFLEGDRLHSPVNVEQMARGIPLTDAQRGPWLGAIHKEIREAFEHGVDLVVACSALKARYREQLAGDIPVTWVYLKGSPDLIRARLQDRASHFMAAAMLESQLEALEEPLTALVVDISLPPQDIVNRIIAGVRRAAEEHTSMQIGMIGLGRMGGNMVRRLARGGHRCVVFDTVQGARDGLVGDGVVAAASIEHLAAALEPPRVVWLMLPALAVDGALADLLPHLQAGDTVVDGGNTHYIDDIRRTRELAGRGMQFVDVGVSGGVWGLERGYCLMIGGPEEAVARLEPIFRVLAPGTDAAAPTPGRREDGRTAQYGYLHCGPAGAGHFVKMVHNGIEYGLMAAYAEGFNLLAHAGVGERPRSADAGTLPPRNPEHFRYSLPLEEIAELWRRGSVIGSWLLDLTAVALAQHPTLDGYSGHVSDSGEGRWAALAAIESGTPAPVLTTSLFERFGSRGADDLANRLLSALREQFGGHREPTREP